MKDNSKQLLVDLLYALKHEKENNGLKPSKELQTAINRAQAAFAQSHTF